MFWSLRLRANDDVPALSGILHGIVGVIENIQENLLQLLRVAEGWGEIFVEVLGHFDAVAGEIIAAKLDGLTQDIVDVNEFALNGALAGETQQVLHDVFGALGLVQDDLEILAGVVGYRGILEQQVGEAKNGGERIIDLVGHAGNQAADGGHLFRMGEFGLEENGVGDVGHDDHDAVHDVLFVAHGAEADRKMAHGGVAAADAQFKVFHLVSVRGGIESGFEIVAV